jgi:hypothetical protein
MSNGHDKDYWVVALEGKTAGEIRAELNTAVANGYGQFWGVNEKFVFLYEGKPK